MEVSNLLVSWFISPTYGVYPTYLHRGYNPFTKYQQDIPVETHAQPFLVGTGKLAKNNYIPFGKLTFRHGKIPIVPGKYPPKMVDFPTTQLIHVSPKTGKKTVSNYSYDGA